MTFLPVVERELRVAVRRPVTWRLRLLAVGVTCLLTFFAISVHSSLRTPAAGRFILQTLAYPALVLCLLAGAMTTADCISSERREGTLGLLFLTDLKGFDVVLGKLAAVSLNSIYCLFAILPILALSMMLGGVMAGVFWRVALALLTALIFSLAIGMWASCWFARENHAVSTAFLLTAAVAIIPLYFPGGIVSLLSPAYAFKKAFAAGATAPGSFWRSILCLWTVSGGLLAWSSFLVTRCWREGEKRRGFRRGPRRRRPNRRLAGILETDPARWLAIRNLERPIALAGAVALAAILPFPLARMYDRDWPLVYVICCLGLNFVVKVVAAGHACHCLVEARRNDGLAMLLATPLTGPQIVRSHARAIKLHLRLPIFILVGVEYLALFFGLTSGRAALRAESGARLFLGVGSLLYFLLFLFEISAVTWTGMWYGLTSKSETAATAKTTFRVLVLPCVSLMFCWIGLPFFFLWPVYWRVTSRQNLLEKFRGSVIMGPRAKGGSAVF